MKSLFLTNAYPSVDKPWLGPAVKLQEKGLKSLGVEIAILYLNRLEKGQAVYLSAFPMIKKRFEEGGFDILHVQFGGVQALLGALVAGRRCVITFHGTDLHGGLPQTMWESISYKIGVICSKLAIAMAGASIAVSKNLLEGLWPKLAKRVEIIPTGVDYQTFRPMDKSYARAQANLSSDCHYVLFCDGNKDPVKRRDLADQAVHILKNRGLNVELLVLTHVPFQKMPLYLNAADVLLVTSEKEGSPNIVKEALACNLPVVSVDVGDVEKMINGVENCVLVSREISAIADSLEAIIASSKRSNGREIKRNLIDNYEICKSIRSIYQELMRSDKH